MSERKLVDLKRVDLVVPQKQKNSRLKVSWTTYQGGRKHRGNPTVQYLQNQ